MIAPTHQQARGWVTLASEHLFGRPPEISEAQAVQGVMWLETVYGSGWRPPGDKSNNMGAMQAGLSWTGDRFSYVDTHPNSDGTSTPYRVDFRKYATPEDGTEDVARLLMLAMPHVYEAMRTGDFHLVSQRMHEARYYEGFGATVEERIDNHYKALSSAVNRIAGALGEDRGSAEYAGDDDLGWFEKVRGLWIPLPDWQPDVEADRDADELAADIEDAAG